MTDFDNKDLTGQADAPETAAPKQPAPETAVPHLTTDPDPVLPEIDVPETPVNSQPAQPFQMPEPPHAPEPPQPEPVYQQAPTYTAPPQYAAPQQPVPPYRQPAPQPNYKPHYDVPPAGYVQKSRLAAGLLAILVGSLGIHNYYLGNNTRGTIQLVVALAGGLLTCGVATVGIGIWSFVEGVLLLSASPNYRYDGNGVILKD